jgi:hypothetical protein
VTIDRRPYAQSLTGEGVLLWADETTFWIGGNATVGAGLDFGDVVVGDSKELEVEMRNSVLNGPAIVFPAAPAVAPAGPFETARDGQCAAGAKQDRRQSGVHSHRRGPFHRHGDLGGQWGSRPPEGVCFGERHRPGVDLL